MEENVRDTAVKENAKMSYEQLEDVAHQLSEQVSIFQLNFVCKAVEIVFSNQL